MLDLFRIYLFVFGAITVAGGVMGFVKAQSKASLIAGSLSGALLLLAGYLVGTHGTAGWLLGLVVSLALAARFGESYRKSKKPMPAGLMTLLGAIGILTTAYALYISKL